MPHVRRRRWGIALPLLALGLGVAALALLHPPAAWLRPGPAAEGRCVAAPTLSLLAFGDTGGNNNLVWPLDEQLAVGMALAAEDARAPVDGLVLLGDNFYMHGLRADSLLRQIRTNLVTPYCRFVALDGLLSEQVADACRLGAPDRHAVPIYAVLGNHDHDSSESPALQREVLPFFVSNWHLGRGMAEVVELGEGVSLVLVDSEPLADEADITPLVEALRSSRGPWRIVAAHRPVASVVGAPYAEAFRRAFVAAGVPVQLFLSGHEHGLQVMTMQPPYPGLHVVSAGGSDADTIEDRGQLWRAEAHGFARIDLAEVDGAPRLVVSMTIVPRFPLAAGRGARRAGCWQVDRAGHVTGGAASSVRAARTDPVS